MSLSSAASDTLEDFGSRQPFFHIGKHDSARHAPLTDAEYGHLLNQGISFVTTPVTNNSFRLKVFQLVSNYLEDLKDKDELATSSATSSRAGPLVWPLTPEDTSLFPSSSVNTYTACISPWIDLCSTDPVISSISRQVLNLEINYASFCGVKSVIIAGPCRDASRDGGNQGLVQYARAIQEALKIGGCLNLLLHMPMYREPIIGHRLETLSVLQQERDAPTDKVIKLFSSWESWHHIRTVCKYNARLCVALKLPRLMPGKDLQNRWFAEPLQYLTISREIFSRNKSGHPCFTTHLQGMLNDYMRLKAAPGLLLCDVGPECRHPEQGPNLMDDGDFPSLAEAHQAATPFQSQAANGANAHMAYLRWLESQQPPMSAFESSTLIGFQDWLQSPLQPLSDNLESATYEVFESDPVKYNQYEATVTKALSEWKELGLPTSKEGAVVVAVAGSGRGPLVTRVLQAAEETGVPVEVWALEKNPNAYVYLLRQNKSAWGGRVKVIKTDMRAWNGPMVSESVETGPVYGKVDILLSELLGAFGDNELSPECLDGIQHVLARPHGVSIPNSYAAHVSPISTPKIYSELLSRSVSDATAFDTPWVVRLYALDFVCQCVPHHPRFQQVWEFSHPIPESTLQAIQAKRSGGVIGGGGGSMAGAAGANDHNSRYCHLCFVCRPGGVIHGLAGYFESTLYASRLERSKGDRIEISTHPERIDDKSKDMISWFPIFFPLKNPITFPADSELEVSMWRQTDDTKVWYEWLVEAWTWTGPSSRIKVGSSDLCSSRKVACLM